MVIDKYRKATLGPLEFYFPVLGTKNGVVCRYCRMCQTDQRDRAREYCLLTEQVLPFADLAIDGRCPLDFGEEDHNVR